MIFRVVAVFFLLSSCSILGQGSSGYAFLVNRSGVSLSLDSRLSTDNEKILFVSDPSVRKYEFSSIPNDTVETMDEYGQIRMMVDNFKFHTLLFIDTIGSFNDVELNFSTEKFSPTNISFNFDYFDDNFRSSQNYSDTIKIEEVGQKLSDMIKIKNGTLWVYGITFYDQNQEYQIAGPKLFFQVKEKSR